tara:strand:+ start:2043 stop:3041 length:999 start_codon:yes stop_codon:yes gene_type:complete
MSLRPWAASTTGGIVGPAEGASGGASGGDARLRLLLQLGAEKARQERVARERAVPVPTDMHAEKRKPRTLPNWMLRRGDPKRKKEEKKEEKQEEKQEQEETNDADDDMNDDDEPGTPPRPLHEGFRLYNDWSIFRVTLSANQLDPGPATFSGPFWQRVQSATTVFPPPEEPRPSLFGGAEPPPPPPAAPAAQLDRSRRTYREFFRLGFGTFLNAYTAKHVDVNDLLTMPEQDNAAGTNFLEVSKRLMEQVTTVEAWSDLPASLTISCGSEGVVRQPQTIRFANVPMYVRDPSKNVSGAYEIDFLFPDAGVEGVMAGRGYNSLLSAAAGSFFS